MNIVIIAIHIIVCALLITLVLIQRGRGGGLVESFAGVESMFGTKTNAFLTRTTTILSIVFFFTCLSLALISIRQSKSLMSAVRPEKEAKETQASAVQKEQLPEVEATTAAAPGEETATQLPTAE